MGSGGGGVRKEESAWDVMDVGEGDLLGVSDGVGDSISLQSFPSISSDIQSCYPNSSGYDAWATTRQRVSADSLRLL